MSKVTPFRPFIPGKKTPPGIRERIVNHARVTERQRAVLIEAAIRILRAGHELTLDAIRAAAPSLELPDVMPLKLQDAANDVRRLSYNPLPHLPAGALADKLDQLGGVAPEVIAHRRRERAMDRAGRMLKPLGYAPLDRLNADGTREPPVWRRVMPNQVEILIFPATEDADVEAPAWAAAILDEHSNRIADSGEALPLRRLLDRVTFMRREKV